MHRKMCHDTGFAVQEKELVLYTRPYRLCEHSGKNTFPWFRSVFQTKVLTYLYNWVLRISYQQGQEFTRQPNQDSTLSVKDTQDKTEHRYALTPHSLLDFISPCW